MLNCFFSSRPFVGWPKLNSLFENGRARAGFGYGGSFSGNAGQLIYWWSASTYTFVSGLVIDLFLQTRNKVVSAYQEIMRMQL